MLSKFGKLLVLGTLAMSAAAITPASADAVFALNGITFTDGGTLSGYFSVNSYGYLNGYDITTTDGTSAVDGHEYTPVINASQSLDQTVIDFIRPSYVGGLHLVFNTPLGNQDTGLQGTIYASATLNLSASYECSTYLPCSNPDLERFISKTEEGSPAPFAAVPEPASLTLMGFGLLAVGFLFARRRKASGLA